jgi:branched-subunit amino acid transport protein AzlD
MIQFGSFQVDECGYTKIMQLMDVFCFHFSRDNTENLATYLRKILNLSVQGLFTVYCVNMYILPVPKY